VRVYRTRDAKKLAKVKQSTSLKLKGFKVALVPDPLGKGEYNVNVDSEGRVVLKSKFSKKTIYLFDKMALARDFENELRNKLGEIPTNRVGIMCGKFELQARAMNKERAFNTAVNLIYAYQAVDANGQLANNHYLNWLEGFYEIEVTNQEEFKLSRKERAKWKKGMSKQKQLKMLKEKSGKGRKRGKKKDRNG
jgi:hypothetical protein